MSMTQGASRKVVKLRCYLGAFLLFALAFLSSQLRLTPSNDVAELPSLEPPALSRLTRTTANFHLKLIDILTKRADDTFVIDGDPQPLLDFAIVGFPKCGTTALHAWLQQHSEVDTLPGETAAVFSNNSIKFIWRLFFDLNQTAIRGYKNPLDVRNPNALALLNQYFPKTVLFVGIRNPVRWFESLYNFKVQNLPVSIAHNLEDYWGDPNTLIDNCLDWMDTNCVGTAKGWFHVHLASLGKVPFPNSWKKKYPLYLNDTQASPRISNPVFLYESRQLLMEDDGGTGTQFRRDIEGILGLDTPLSSIVAKTKPDFDHFDDSLQKRKDAAKIDICEPKFLPLRTELMRLAREASPWITEDFLASDEVYVSSPLYFRQLMNDWMSDPCDSVI